MIIRNIFIRNIFICVVVFYFFICVLMCLFVCLFVFILELCFIGVEKCVLYPILTLKNAKKRRFLRFLT